MTRVLALALFLPVAAWGQECPFGSVQFGGGSCADPKTGIVTVYENPAARIEDGRGGEHKIISPGHLLAEPMLTITDGTDAGLHWFLSFSQFTPSCTQDTFPAICSGVSRIEVHAPMPTREVCEQVKELLKKPLSPKCWASAGDP